MNISVIVIVFSKNELKGKKTGLRNDSNDSVIILWNCLGIKVYGIWDMSSVVMVQLLWMYCLQRASQKLLFTMDSIPYCPPDVNITDIWSNCFFETLRTFICAGFIVIFGLKQLIIYWRYATPISNTSSSKLYYFQIILLTLIPSLVIADFSHIYGYTVWKLFLSFIYRWSSLHLVIDGRVYRILSKSIHWVDRMKCTREWNKVVLITLTRILGDNSVSDTVSALLSEACVTGSHVRTEILSSLIAKCNQNNYDDSVTSCGLWTLVRI